MAGPTASSRIAVEPNTSEPYIYTPVNPVVMDRLERRRSMNRYAIQGRYFFLVLFVSIFLNVVTIWTGGRLPCRYEDGCFGIQQKNDFSRDVFPPGCNWKCYLVANPDLVEVESKIAAETHYTYVGKKENRSCECSEGNDNSDGLKEIFPPGCDWKCYLVANPDLKDIDTKEAAETHYRYTGNRENRRCNCLQKTVVESRTNRSSIDGATTNASIEKKGEKKAKALAKKRAKKEAEKEDSTGEFPSDWDWRCYFISNPDLLDHFEWTKEDAEAHYTRRGKKEGRSTDCIPEDEFENEGEVDEAEVKMKSRLKKKPALKTSFPADCDWRCYFMMNPDVAKSLPWTEDAAEKHYRHIGRQETRRCDCRKDEENVKHCCFLQYHPNIGHLLTENAVDLYRCRPVVSFQNVWRLSEKNAVTSQFYELAEMLGVDVTSREECVKYYDSNPSEHAEGDRLSAYSRMKGVGKSWYDAVAVSQILRKVSEIVLDACKIEIPERFPEKFKPPNGRNGDPYEPLYERRKSKSVIIVVRRPMRTLLNADELLAMCQGLALDCRIFEPSVYFENIPKRKRLCRALKEFRKDNSLVIGVQGAEMTYAIFGSLRLFLMSFKEQFNTDSACRVGNRPSAWEEQVAKNLICRGYGLGIDPFYMEFTHMYGSQIHLVRSTADRTSLESQTDLKLPEQCENKDYWCADRVADVDDVKRGLEKLITDGKLLTVQN